MAASEISPVKKTALNAAHRQLGGKMVEFAGWDLPTQFKGVIEEHMAVRTRAGLFDVSHMGEVEISGPDSLEFLQWITCNNAAKLQVGQIQYSALMHEAGSFVDDLLVNRLGEHEYMLCINAANVDKDMEYIQSQVRGDVNVINRSDDYVQLALQGPNALPILAEFTAADLPSLKYYRLVKDAVLGAPSIISRTGYTGEDGFEIYTAPEHAEKIWFALLERGEKGGFGLQPIGLAARDTLRLEAKMALYGNDIDDSTTVYEADLGWIVKLKKGDFIGRDVLLRQKEEGVKRILAGFEMVGRGIARHGYPLVHNGEECGRVTSGSFAPYLKKNIGLGYLPPELSPVGTEIAVLIRGMEVPAIIVETPFYKRQK